MVSGFRIDLLESNPGDSERGSFQTFQSFQSFKASRQFKVQRFNVKRNTGTMRCGNSAKLRPRIYRRRWCVNFGKRGLVNAVSGLTLLGSYSDASINSILTASGSYGFSLMPPFPLKRLT